ncbi:hypothetical protein D9757_005031 [Collybiopsis confluens]|uniref:Zn(2)-C6 fungal-type domain-containing protein n=1 Tax=Collybiopsis confluens TaxID=2823264 RepID=A0A8H5HSX1_9AGAR|nr:hypothetical protein D9757_005031 [Collybiopsis confluens]
MPEDLDPDLPPPNIMSMFPQTGSLPATLPSSPPGSSGSGSQVHHASLVNQSIHSPALLRLIDVKLSKEIIDYVVNHISEIVQYALGIPPPPPTRGRTLIRHPKFSTFVTNILIRADVTMPVVLTSLAYVDRARPYLIIPSEDWALERVFLGALIVASKVIRFYRLPPNSSFNLPYYYIFSTDPCQMGGDHKCPVCSATFTRPQHVVRHMRSHTGDRPYKCQHCGDQFSRSDLLSRHVNKCHVGEKALGPGGAPAEGQGRRKGIGASTTRATTSKQACDQCVQSSLPCDGCNPCAKCIQRKVRCTFVKFHRQTAPIGPGHNPSRTVNSSSSVSSSILPLPHIPSQQSAAGFNPAVTQAYDSIYGTYDLPSSMAPLGYTAEEAPFILQPAPGSSTSYANNYRAQQADLHRRASFPPINPSGQTWISGWQGNPENATPTSFAPENHFAFDVANDLRNQPFPLRHPHQNPTQTQNQNQNQHVYGQHPHNPNATTSTRSFSSSSSSSNHDHDSRPGTASDISDGPSRPGTSSSFGSRPGTSGGTDPSSSTTNRNENPAFSSAFGLMSLDDPAVLAGLANDGAPFFSHLTGVDPTAAAAAAAAANGTLDGGIQSMGGGAGVGGDGVPTTTGFVGVGGMRNNDPDATPMPIGEAQSLGLVGAGSQAPSNTGVNGSSPKQLHHFPSRGRPSTGHGHGLGNGGSTLGIGEEEES